MSTHVLSTSRKHITSFLVKRFWGMQREYGVDDRLVLAVNPYISAQKFVSASGKLNHNCWPLLLDSDKSVCCHHSSLLWYCLHPLKKFQWVNSRYGLFPYLHSCVMNCWGVVNTTTTNNKQLLCYAFSCTWHALTNNRRVKQWINCTVNWKKKPSACNVYIGG